LTRACVDPRRSPGTRDYIVAVTQQVNGVAGIGIRGVAAYEAVGLRYRAGDSAVTVAPGHRAARAVPQRTDNQVIAVAQEYDGIAYLIAGAAADNAVGFGDDTANSDTSVAPRHRATVAVPSGS